MRLTGIRKAFFPIGFFAGKSKNRFHHSPVLALGGKERPK